MLHKWKLLPGACHTVAYKMLRRRGLELARKPGQVLKSFRLSVSATSLKDLRIPKLRISGITRPQMEVPVSL